VIEVSYGSRGFLVGEGQGEEIFLELERVLRLLFCGALT
jgi:hypothetical protein